MLPNYTTQLQERVALPAGLIRGGVVTRQRCSKTVRYSSQEGKTPPTFQNSAPSCMTQRPGPGALPARSTRPVVVTPQHYCQMAMYWSLGPVPTASTVAAET